VIGEWKPQIRINFRDLKDGRQLQRSQRFPPFPQRATQKRFTVFHSRSNATKATGTLLPGRALDGSSENLRS
jgi:hypothetical protein